MGRFHGNDYAVPTAYARQEALAVGGLDEVRLVVGNHAGATHLRLWSKEGVSFRPERCLALLERKPGALDFAKPFADWRLPACFGVRRRRLEREQPKDGRRRFAEVLRLWERATPRELTTAVERAPAAGALDRAAVRILRAHGRAAPPPLFALDGRPHRAAVQAPLPDRAADSALRTEVSP